VLSSDEKLNEAANRFREIHRRFYDQLNSSPQSKPSVKDIVTEMRCKVLGGECLVFSGLIPTNARADEQYIWTTAERYGAQCQNEITDQTTVLVAAKRGTSKVLKAETKGIKIVNIDWLWTAVRQWTLPLPEDYPVPIDGMGFQQYPFPNPYIPPIHSSPNHSPPSKRYKRELTPELEDESLLLIEEIEDLLENC